MKLSFVIPLFNKEKNIIATLKSIISACEENNINDSYEIIVVDDGSTDSSGKVVREFIQLKNSCVRYYFQNNSGPSMARNRGVSESTGEYILFVDADDLLLPAYIAYIL
ncbi:glycosyltransferase family 2 protein, partial [Escherichia coli]